MKIDVNLQKVSGLGKGKILSPINAGDAGYDIFSSSYPKIVGEQYKEKLFTRIDYIEYETNVALQPGVDEFNEHEIYSLIFPRSSISTLNLHLCNSVGVIDSGYTNSIKLRFKYIPQPENYYVIDGKNLLIGIDESKIYSKGDRIAQVLFMKHIHPKIFITKKLDETERGEGGFGSTGL